MNNKSRSKMKSDASQKKKPTYSKQQQHALQQNHTDSNYNNNINNTDTGIGNHLNDPYLNLDQSSSTNPANAPIAPGSRRSIIPPSPSASGSMPVSTSPQLTAATNYNVSKSPSSTSVQQQMYHQQQQQHHQKAPSTGGGSKTVVTTGNNSSGGASGGQHGQSMSTSPQSFPSNQPASVPIPSHSSQQPIVGPGQPQDVLCPAVRRMGYTSNVQETIGEGAFSRVYRARSSAIANKDIAVKIVRVDDPNIPQAWKDHSMKRELKILKRVRHPNVITVYDVIKTRTRIYIFMDLAAASVASHLEATEEPASEQTARSWFGGISNAIAYLHHCEIAHRDIKNENILIDSNGHAKLTDFGFACFTYDKVTKCEILARTSCGTKAYVAPEVFNPPYNAKIADVWSLGICLFETVTLLQPFRDDLPTAVFVRRQVERGLVITNKIRDKISDLLIDLLKKMVEPSVNKRLRSEAILIHPWMRMTRST